MFQYLFLSKSFYKKMHSSKMSMFVWFFVVGLIDMVRFYFYKVFEIPQDILRINIVYNILISIVITFIIGFLHLTLFSMPIYDLLKYLKKRQRSLEKRLKEIFGSEEDGVIIEVSKKTQFETNNQIDNDENLKIVMKTYVLTQIPIVFYVTIAILLYYFFGDSISGNYQNIFALFVFFIIIWKFGILVRGLNIIGNFSKPDKILIFILAYLWVIALEIVLDRVVNVSMEYLLIFE